MKQGKHWLEILSIAGVSTVLTILPGCGVPAYRQAIAKFSQASVATLDVSEQFVKAVSANERKNILYDRVDTLHDIQSVSDQTDLILLQDLEPGHGGILDIEMFIARVEAIKVVRGYIKAIGELAASDSGKIAGDSLQELGSSVTRLHILTASASKSKEKLNAFAQNAAIISAGVAYLTESAFVIAVEEKLDEAILKAAPGVNKILELLQEEIQHSHQIAGELTGTNLNMWLAEFNLEAKRLRNWSVSHNGVMDNLETLVRFADHVVSAIEARDALKREDPTKAIAELRKAHAALTSLAEGERTRLDLESFNAALDRSLARARSMTEALKAYREAVAKRPDATPSDLETLLQATIDLVIGRLKESAGIPDLKYP